MIIPPASNQSISSIIIRERQRETERKKEKRKPTTYPGSPSVCTVEVWSGLWLQLCGLDHQKYQDHLVATLKPFPFLEIKLTYFTASYTCNQHIKLSPPPLCCLTLTLPLYSSLSAFLSLSLPISLSPPSVSACCNSLDIDTPYMEGIC